MELAGKGIDIPLTELKPGCVGNMVGNLFLISNMANGIKAIMPAGALTPQVSTIFTNVQPIGTISSLGIDWEEISGGRKVNQRAYLIAWMTRADMWAVSTAPTSSSTATAIMVSATAITMASVTKISVVGIVSLGSVSSKWLSIAS